MTDAVYRRFPDHIKAIEELLKKDVIFREMCTDYEKLTDWLNGYCSLKGRASLECDHARDVIRDLEKEIIYKRRAVSYLTKPFSPEQLRLIVRKALDGRDLFKQKEGYHGS